MQFVRHWDSPFHISHLLLISLALFVLFSSAIPGFVTSQNPPTKDNQEGTVQTQMRNVTFHFSDTVAVEIKSLNGVLVPLGKNEFPNLDDKDSFNLRVSTAEIAMDSSDLANVLNSYVQRVSSQLLSRCPVIRLLRRWLVVAAFPVRKVATATELFAGLIQTAR